MSTSVPILSDLRIANSVRLIYAMFRLAADIETGFGKALLDILQSQFPDQDVDASPSQVGHKMMNIALKELQKNPSDAMDSIQDWLTYISVGYGGDPENPQTYPFNRDHDTWEEALKHAYSNLRKRSISKSRTRYKIEKEEVVDPDTGEVKEVEKQTRREKGIEEAFGRRTEEGGHEKAEERMPAPEDNEWGRALDDQAAIKEFMDLMDAFVPELVSTLPYEQQTLFNLIFEQGIGTFQSDIKANMAQASELKNVFQRDAESDDSELAEKAKGVLKRYGKRWSGFVGDTRKKLLDNIQSFVEKYLPEHEYDILWDTFFADVSPQDIEKAEAEKTGGKEQEQLEKDVRKLGRFKWKEQQGKLNDRDKKSYTNLKKKLEKAGVDVEAIGVLEPGEKPTTTEIPMKGETKVAPPKAEAKPKEEEEEEPATQRMPPKAKAKPEEEEEEGPATQRMSEAELKAAEEEEEEEEPPTMRFEEEPKTQRMHATSILAMVLRIVDQPDQPVYL